METDRLNKFLLLKNDAWYGNLFKKLRKSDIEFCIDWIQRHSELSDSEFSLAVDRTIFLCSAKSKAERNRLNICQELISVSI